MVESLFISANEWMAGGSSLAAIGCFAWGLISVLFSPCHLGSIPLMVAYVGGQRAILMPRQAAVYAAVFSLGLFISIAVVGVVCAWLGRMLGDIGSWWQAVVGAGPVLADCPEKDPAEDQVSAEDERQPGRAERGGDTGGPNPLSPFPAGEGGTRHDRQSAEGRPGH